MLTLQFDEETIKLAIAQYVNRQTFDKLSERVSFSQGTSNDVYIDVNISLSNQMINDALSDHVRVMMVQAVDIKRVSLNPGSGSRLAAEIQYEVIE